MTIRIFGLRQSLCSYLKQSNLAFSFSIPLAKYSTFPSINTTTTTMTVSTLASAKGSITATGITDLAYKVLKTSDPCTKVKITQEIHKLWQEYRQQSERQELDLPTKLTYDMPNYPSRPSLPEIVKPCSMPSAKTCGFPMNIFYLHGLAHVELNAIDLCFDTFLRFYMDDVEWYDDWISIANDESRHFSFLHKRLSDLDCSYGCLPAHGIIWEGAMSTMTNRKKRIAIGQLVAEARGLDAGEKLAKRIQSGGDKISSDIVMVIAHEEVRHVQIGVKWYLKEFRNDVDSAIKEFHEIAVESGNQGAFVPPFNQEKRSLAGMTPEWYEPVAVIMKEIREQRKKQLS